MDSSNFSIGIIGINDDIIIIGSVGRSLDVSVRGSITIGCKEVYLSNDKGLTTYGFSSSMNFEVKLEISVVYAR